MTHEIDANRPNTARKTKGNESALIAQNVTLVFYTMTVYYMVTIFAIMMLYGCFSVLHVGFDALFRSNAHWARIPSVQRTMRALDWLLSPGAAFEFASARFWGAHALILACVMAAAALHGALAVKSGRGQNRDNGNDAPSRSAISLYKETLSTVYVVFWGMYGVVILREILRIISAEK